MSAMPPWPGLARRLRDSRARPPFAANGAGQEATVAFRCNLCGRANRVAPARIGREVPSCDGCGSTVRFRTIGRLVMREALGSDAALCDVTPDRRIRGLGLSDAEVYAKPLARAFAYENTYFHASPRLDILRIPTHRRGRYDFLIASDVFEHVAPPIDLAFRNAHALLAAGGVFIFSVPFTLADDTVEHLPDLHDWHLQQRNRRCRVINRTRGGRVQVFRRAGISRRRGHDAGNAASFRAPPSSAILPSRIFGTSRIAAEPCATFGIAWPEPLSVPIVAHACETPSDPVDPYPSALIPAGPEGAAIRDAFLADERSTLVALAAQVTQDDGAGHAIAAQARAWVEAVRSDQQKQGGIESFLQQYDLSTPEGVLLMCVAEALLRIPDAATADALIRDKLSRGDWDRHLGDVRFAARQCVDVGTDADRQADAHRARRRARSARPGTSASSRAPANPSCASRAPGDEGDGRAIRARPHDRRSRRAQRALPSSGRTGIRTTCWARRR